MKKHIVALKSLKERSLTRAKDLYVFVFIAVYINLAEKTRRVNNNFALFYMKHVSFNEGIQHRNIHFPENTGLVIDMRRVRPAFDYQTKFYTMNKGG